MERPELEEQQQKLVSEVNANQRMLKELEDTLLFELTHNGPVSEEMRALVQSARPLEPQCIARCEKKTAPPGRRWHAVTACTAASERSARISGSSADSEWSSPASGTTYVAWRTRRPSSTSSCARSRSPAWARSRCGLLQLLRVMVWGGTAPHHPEGS